MEFQPKPPSIFMFSQLTSSTQLSPPFSQFLQHLVLTIFIILYRLWVIGFNQLFLPVLFFCFLCRFTGCERACEFLHGRGLFDVFLNREECLLVVDFGEGMILYHVIFPSRICSSRFPSTGNDRNTENNRGVTIVTKEIPHCFSMSSKGDFS